MSIALLTCQTLHKTQSKEQFNIQILEYKSFLAALTILQSLQEILLNNLRKFIIIIIFILQSSTE